MPSAKRSLRSAPILTTLTKPKAPWKTLLALAWPLVIANSFWNLQLTIDRVFLGQFSTAALAASIAVSGVFWAPMALLQQSSAYVMTFVAQNIGAKNDFGVGASLWQSIYVAIIGGLLFLLLIPLSSFVFGAIGHSSGVQILEIKYFSALCWSALPSALVASMSGVITGLEQTKKLITVNGVGLVANVFFDYIFIFGHWGSPELGVEGAGYATALSATVSFGVAIFYVFSKGNDKKYGVRSHWRLNKSLMGRYLWFSIPSGLQWALEGVAFTVFLVYVGRMSQGDAALASSGIAVTLMLLAILPAMGIAQAASVLVGQQLGSERPDEAQHFHWAGVRLVLIYCLCVSGLLVFAGDFLVHFFEQNEAARLWAPVAALAPKLLLFVAVMILFDGFNLMFSYTLKGAGDTLFVSLVSLIVPWPLMVLPTWWFYKSPGGIYWAWTSVVLYIAVMAGIHALRYRWGPWRSMSVLS